MSDDTPTDNLPVERDAKGRFLTGMSGNPTGRPKGSKNHIKELRLAHEEALREYMAEPDRAKKIFESMDRLLDIAVLSEDKVALGALKIITDQFLPKRVEDDSGSKGPGKIVIQIDNQTLPERPGRPNIVIEGISDAEDAEFTEEHNPTQD